MSWDPGVFTRAREQFEQLVEASAAERAERLAALTIEDPALTRLVEELLRADAREDGFLERPASELAREATGDGMADENETLPDSIGELVGPYRLVALLGRGGMGEVYLADRTDGQFEQQVALKLLKRGMDSDEILRRFLRERQILARLDHPNIARLLDGGVAPDHRPYFVLEHVAGTTITEYCATRGSASMSV
ncbi:MAG: protein kinase [Acidobacteria bacterium]|nr:protein kinase [Acidobacteriota bacterium]